MKLKKLIPEDVVQKATKEYEKGKDFQDFVINTADESNVDEKYIKLYKQVTENFQYLTWLEMYNEEYPNAMPVEKYISEKKQYTDELNKYTGKY